MSMQATPNLTPTRSVTQPLQPRRRLYDNGRANHSGTASPMHPSFAQIRFLLLAAVLASALSACASLPPPTGELAAAGQAVTRAENADADQYAGRELGAARSALSQAQAAMSGGDEDEARRLALAAAADADLAYARSREALATAELNQRRAEVSGLRNRLQTEGQP
ncbi:MAG TPA: DUF4398 domain-containing protein [Lysobacter sp.]